jgi:hypothetical protein
MMADKQDERKSYRKPEIRRIKLSLAELTLGTNCDGPNPGVQSGGCPPTAAACNN